MAKKVIVAGMGHGGIAAAALLADAGLDVTVYEQKKEGTLGYDWTDIFAPKALGIAGMEMPPEHAYTIKEDMTFFNPNGSTPLRQHVDPEKAEIKMERRDIYAHLIQHAINCGVKIQYETKVQGVLTLGSRVVGIHTDKGDYLADLIIDACGMQSPVRRSLPDSFHIQKEVKRSEKITIYRAFYNKGDETPVSAKFKVMLFPKDTKGIAWIATEQAHTDLLVGRFEDLTLAGAQAFADVLREENPSLGTEVQRGGQIVEIPVRQTLSLMVADGYAAIGDSAFMTVPLIGSGIANSLKAARILADTVLADKAGAYTAATLWRYQVRYYQKVGAKLAPLACGKKLLLSLTPEQVDQCFESGMITENDVTMDAEFGSLLDMLTPFDPAGLVTKARQVCKDPVLLKKIAACGAQIAAATAVCTAMPLRWNKTLVNAWIKAYDKVFDAE